MAKFSNMSVAAFKDAIGVTEINVVENRVTGGRFASVTLSDGTVASFRVQNGIDLTGDVEMLLIHEDDDGNTVNPLEALPQEGYDNPSFNASLNQVTERPESSHFSAATL